MRPKLPEIVRSPPNAIEPSMSVPDTSTSSSTNTRKPCVGDNGKSVPRRASSVPRSTTPVITMAPTATTVAAAARFIYDTICEDVVCRPRTGGQGPIKATAVGPRTRCAGRAGRNPESIREHPPAPPPVTSAFRQRQSSAGAAGPAGHAGDAQHQHPVERLVPVLRVAAGQAGGQALRPVEAGLALPAQLGPHPPQL